MVPYNWHVPESAFDSIPPPASAVLRILLLKLTIQGGDELAMNSQSKNVILEHTLDTLNQFS
jgi:hypothetical protein